ncbi:hypothetical protein DXG01_004461 [Tephrocybe rancida]|nr:hypothetical protein DXG01_004461 [Tephrocybe rancida]
MVADFVSAEFGWLESPDGAESVHVYFKAGKAREGYFTSESIQQQTEKAMAILEKWYPQFEHVLIFDNATTHTKHPDDAPSTRKMTKSPPVTFGCEVTVEVNGKPANGTNGKPQKKCVKMVPGQMADGNGKNLTAESKLNAECKGFKCQPNMTAGCQQRVLFNQPDFMDVESVLKTKCKTWGI